MDTGSQDKPQTSQEQPLFARLGPYIFEHRSYDPPTDTLILTRGSTEGAASHTTVEGHELLLDPKTGEVLGLTVRNYEARLFDGPIEVTLPGPHEHDPDKAERLRLWMASTYSGMCC